MTAKLVAISRFNLPHPIWKERSAQDYRDWLKSRVDLFTRLTVPSFRNCYEKPDVWLIMVDERNEPVSEMLAPLLKGLSVKLVSYNGAQLGVRIQQALADLSYPCQIRTCRIDTDDLIAAGYFAQYRNIKVPESWADKGAVLSYPGGALYDSATERFYISCYPDNPFLCYIENCARPDDMQTVFKTMHTKLIEQSAHVKMLRSFGPMWASVLHGENLANESLRNTVRFELQPTDALERLFGLKRS